METSHSDAMTRVMCTPTGPTLQPTTTQDSSIVMFNVEMSSAVSPSSPSFRLVCSVGSDNQAVGISPWIDPIQLIHPQ